MKAKMTILGVLSILVVSQVSYGALNAYLRLTGDIQGEIRGGVTQAGREDSIMVIGMSHSVVAPRDAATGKASGKRQHGPITITKEIDKSTPLLMNALVHNENISEWRLEHWEPSPSGQEVQYYTIELINAQIVGIRQEMLNNKYPENMQHKEREHVSFVYEKIIWTYQDGGITAEDDWDYAGGGDLLISDLTGDGVVNLLDLAIVANEWLMSNRLR